MVLEFVRVEHAEDAWAFRFAPQDYLLRSAGGSFERATFSWDESLLADLAALRQPHCDPVIPQRIGERLRRFVTPLGWPELAAELGQALAQRPAVIITVRSAAAELYALPWELLTLKASGQHLGELPNVLLRYEWPDTATVPESPLPRRGSGRILVAWSAAGGTVPAAEQIRAVAAAASANLPCFDPARDVIEHVSPGRLAKALAAAEKEPRPISILHLLCHGARVGGSYGFVLDGEGERGERRLLAAAELRQILGPYAKMVRLAVLLACDGDNPGQLGNELGSVAQALHRVGIAGVVASRFPLSRAGSIRFTELFYDALLGKLASLESALLAARQQLGTVEPRDASSLKLHARAADGPETRPLVFRPYPGLAAFGSLERRFYFGREALVSKLWSCTRELLQRAGAPRLLAVLGPSGSGKSSVARAGLLPELERRPLAFAADQAAVPPRLVELKPGSHPLGALAAALAALPAADAGRPLIILVDQFEETYTLCTDAAERAAFVELLLCGACTPGLPLLVVMTLRTDFIGETQQQHPKLNRLFDEQAKLVTLMSEEEMRRAIAEPAAQLGLPLDEATVNLLLREVEGRSGALPLLQFALSQLWEGMLAGRSPASTLQELGGVGGALAGRAQAFYDELNERDQATARRALVRLVRLGDGVPDTRRRMPLSALCGRGESEAEVLAVLRRFASDHARLITLSADGSETIAEVTHEALFYHWTALHGWIAQSRQDHGLDDRALEAAALWQRAGRPAGRLWRPPDLDLLRDFEQRKPEDLGALQAEFLAAGLRQQQSELRLRIGLIAALFITVLLASGIYIAKERQRVREATAAETKIRQQFLNTYVDSGQELLFSGQAKEGEALLLLHHAYQAGSTHPSLGYLLKSAMRSIDGLQAALVGHTERVLGASFSPDGQRIVTASADSTARVFDARSGRALAELHGHSDEVQSARFSPDGQRILTTSRDGSARLFGAAGGQALAVLHTEAGPIRSARFSPDGQRIVAASGDATASIFSAGDGQRLAVLRGHTGEVRSAAFSPDGQRIVTASHDFTARIWSAADGRPLTQLSGHTDLLYGARFSPDGRWVVTVSEDRTARVWDAGSGAPIARLDLPLGGATSADFSPDGKYVLTTGVESGARLFVAADGQPAHELGDSGGGVLLAAFSPDGLRIATANFDGAARIYDAHDGRLLRRLGGHTGPIHSVSFSPDGGLVATASADRTARVFRTAEVRLLQEWRLADASAASAAFSRDGRRLAVASSDGVARIFDTETGRRLLAIGDHQEGLRSAAFSADGRRLVTTGRGKTARVYDSASGGLLLELAGHTHSLYGASYSPDDRQILTWSADKTARIHSAADGQLIAVLKGPESSLLSASYSRDGRRIITVRVNRSTQTFDAQSGRLLGERQLQQGAIESAAADPSGLRIVTTDREGRVGIWELHSGRPLAMLKECGGQSCSAAFSADGRRIVTTSHDRIGRIFSAEDAQLLSELPAGATGEGSTASLATAQFSEDGQRVAIASSQGTVQLWDVSLESRSPERLAQLLRCYVPARLEQPERKLITAAIAAPGDCQGDRR